MFLIFLSKIPLWVWAIPFAVCCFFIYGHVRYSAGVNDTIAAQFAKGIKIQTLQEKITVQMDTKFLDRDIIIVQQGKDIIKEVPVYVTKEDDARCTVNVGFVELWNRTNSGTIPDSAGQSNEAASPIVLSDIATQHSIEATICHRTENQLISLQDWVREQQKVK